MLYGLDHFGVHHTLCKGDAPTDALAFQFSVLQNVSHDGSDVPPYQLSVLQNISSHDGSDAWAYQFSVLQNISHD